MQIYYSLIICLLLVIIAIDTTMISQNISCSNKTANTKQMMFY